MNTNKKILIVGGMGLEASEGVAAAMGPSGHKVVLIDGIPHLPLHCRPEPVPVFDVNLFQRKQSEGRRIDGSLKRRF